MDRIDRILEHIKTHEYEPPTYPHQFEDYNAIAEAQERQKWDEFREQYRNDSASAKRIALIALFVSSAALLVAIISLFVSK